MGHTLWSDEHYRSRAEMHRRMGTSHFRHDADIRAQRTAARAHPQMDPKRLKNGRRESRDGAEHPDSRAVAVLFDVTGSMGEVPRILQKSLTSLFGLCLRRGYLQHPAILVGGVGDATCDAVPLQVGQFESGNEVDDDLSRLYLEGGGGGQQTESYELALYFLARKTAIDCFEKRGRKGHAFLIGDEMPYRAAHRDAVKEVFGDDLPENVPVEQLVKEVRERWELHYIIPRMSSYYDDPKIFACWKRLLGPAVLKLQDPAGISELIGSLIGIGERAVDRQGVAGDLKKAGVASEVVQSVVAALGPAAIPGTGLVAP